MNPVELLLMLGMLAVFLFFFFIPQQKKAKQEATFREELKKGQRVVTSGGIIGKITEVNTHTVTLSLDGKNTCKFTKGAISKEMTDALEASDS